MPYADAMLLSREFDEHPPLRFTFTHFVGYKNPNRKIITDPKAFWELQKHGGDAMPRRPLPPHLREAIKWAEDMKSKRSSLRTQ
jgi:hypothetical protein